MAAPARNPFHATRGRTFAVLITVAVALGGAVASHALAAPPLRGAPADATAAGQKALPQAAPPTRSTPATSVPTAAQGSNATTAAKPASAAAVNNQVVGLSTAPRAAAGNCPVAIAGPTQVVRAKGEPRLDMFSFSSPDPNERHVLRIDNGGANGAMRPVTSASVELNGRQVLAPNRFNPQVRTIEQQIEVKENSQLGLRLAGEPNSGLSFTVSAVDSRPPVFVSVHPASGSVVSEPQVTLVVTLDDALSGPKSLHCAGVEATPVDGVFACTVPLAVGPSPIELVAADACGNERRVVVTIEYDPPPAVAITSPSDGALFLLGNPVVVTGTVDDPAASVTVNGVPATGRPTFTATVPVRKGPNTLVAVARDAAGGESSDSVEITVLTGASGPTVSISSPKDNFVVGGARPTNAQSLGPQSVTVTGRVRAGGGTSAAPVVKVSGVAATVTLRSGQGPLCTVLINGMCDWAFSAQLSLYKGDNPQLIRAVARDYQDGTDEDTVSGNVDECVPCDPSKNASNNGKCTAAADGNAIRDADAGQSNLCHVIDGCSAPIWAGGQDPTDGKLNKEGTSTAFGESELEMDPLVHGLPPHFNLPCNKHDICYQTCGADKRNCDKKMHDDMLAVCRKAYPEETCPYQPNFLKCEQWRHERAKCYANADKYRLGLTSPQADVRFAWRQDEFCYRR